MQKLLIIQTAFIGDVVLATALIEKLKTYYPDAQIDFLLRQGNEGLLQNHPALHEVLVWNKKKKKFRNLFRLLRQIRRSKYDVVINVQRFAATGILTAFSGARQRIGFNKNPFSLLFTKRLPHRISKGYPVIHEVARNADLISGLTDSQPAKPRLYPSVSDWELVKKYKSRPYITVSPASVWFTKQFPKEKWISFLDGLPQDYPVYLLGASTDQSLAAGIIRATTHTATTDLSGQLSFLQSAALMCNADMNYVNDSAPLHFASAMNAPVTAVYCSTLPAFGFGPLSDKSFTVETELNLSCRPCGLHGLKACPLGHFNCAFSIHDEQLLATLSSSETAS